MNAEAAACEVPVRTLCWSGFDQSRKPDERDRKRSTVCEINSEQVLIHSNVDDALTRSCFRSSHARPLAVWRVQRVARGGCAQAQGPRIRDFARVPTDSARTWLCSRPDRCERAEARPVRDCKSRRGRSASQNGGHLFVRRTYRRSAAGARATAKPARRPRLQRLVRQRRSAATVVGVPSGSERNRAGTC